MGRGMILAAGFILIGLGIGGLIWSHLLDSGANATANAWWVGTLQALGVGFTVGGLIDVLAVSGLEGVMRAEEGKRKDFNTRAMTILNSEGPDRRAALDLLTESKGLLDKDLRTALYDLITDQPGPAPLD